MQKYYHIVFWVVTFIVLTLTFSQSYGGYAQSFYFVTFLFPVILGTSVFFNSFLIPKFLFRKKYFKFVQYSLYAIIFSVYLEILVLTLSLIVFANYQYDQLNPKTTDIVFLTVVMYFLVFLNTIVLLLREYLIGQEKNRKLTEEYDKLKTGILTVRSERKYINIPFDSIDYLESVGNYVKITPSKGKIILTKERFSVILDKLPNAFLRIHRSIVVNTNRINSFNREWITINDLEFPISRKYKEEVLKTLSPQL